MALMAPYSDEKESERALRRGRVLAEIVRSHYENRPISNQKILRNFLSDRHRQPFNQSTLAGDIKWLEEANWIERNGQAIRLRKRDYQLIADSFCANALSIAAELAGEDATFNVSDWKDRCALMLAKDSNLSTERVGQRCDEFLEEFADCGYLLRRTNLKDEIGEFDVGRWNQDWFYLVVAVKAKLRRPFHKRRSRRP
jgi:hypothetical protein